MFGNAIYYVNVTEVTEALAKKAEAEGGVAFGSDVSGLVEAGTVQVSGLSTVLLLSFVNGDK
ncbi:hypothetical protein SPFM12_00108 [Salmonella phage SPFM12]|nr:hypothetical protein SPFM12_00108 [Salmonella phage SPFM12]